MERTLRGLLVQEHPVDQLMVVDDASPRPATIPVDLSSGVEIVRLPENLGLSEARNRGALGTTSTYLLFVNCDVVLKPSWLDNGLAFMESNLNAGAVSGRIVPIAGPEVLRDWRLQFIETKSHRSVLTGPTPVTWLVGHTMLVRRTVFDEVGGFDPRFRSAGEDWDFSQRIRSSGYLTFHHPELVAESHELASIENLARKNVRNAGWDLRPRADERVCAAVRPVRPLPATVSLVRTLIQQVGRDLVKRRFRFLPVDLAITARSIVLVWRAPRMTRSLS